MPTPLPRAFCNKGAPHRTDLNASQNPLKTSRRLIDSIFQQADEAFKGV